jgi:hypothetical protein
MTIADALREFTWNEDQIVQRATRWCEAANARKIPLSKWQALSRKLAGAQTYTEFAAALAEHLVSKQGQKPRWPAKDPNELRRELAGLAQARESFDDDLAFVERTLELLPAAEKNFVQDAWKLARARLFLQSVIKQLKISQRTTP